MDVATEVVDVAQLFGDSHKLLHCVIGRLNDARTEEQTLNVIAAIEVEGQGDHFVNGEPSTLNVARDTVDAVKAVVDADVGQKDLEQRHAATVRGVAVTDAGAGGVPDALGRTCALGAAAGA